MNVQYTRETILYIKEHAEEIGDESIAPETMVDLIYRAPDCDQFVWFLYHHCDINVMEQLKDKVVDRSGLFWCDDDLTEIVIPGYCKVIPEDTCRSCSHLSKVTIEEGITEIRKNAFYCATNLTEIKLPKSVAVIGNAAFKGNIMLESVDLSNVEEIGDSAFERCDLKSITIPKTCKTLEARAFFWNPLESVTIEDGLEEIGTSVFCNCPHLKVIEFPQTLRKVYYGPTGTWTNNTKYNSGKVKYKIRGLNKAEAREWAARNIDFIGDQWWTDLFIHKII